MANYLGVPKVYLEPGDDIVARLTSTVKGKTFVATAAGGVGNRPVVATCPAGARSSGVANRDGVAGEFIGVISEGVVEVLAGAALTAGQTVQSDANGFAIPLAAGVPLGIVNADTPQSTGPNANNGAPINLIGM